MDFFFGFEPSAALSETNKVAISPRPRLRMWLFKRHMICHLNQASNHDVLGLLYHF
ncbi:uncharacterized protein DS421_1g13530 [Arachis hypogaea]|nr:uncharacterized protein DS421_1g13530 [Arachis hypogaea]